MLHLVTLKLIPQPDPDSCKESRSRLSVMVSARDDIVLYIRQSWANRRTDERTDWGRSFMHNRKNSGPRTVPWGTQTQTTDTNSDFSPSTTAVGEISTPWPLYPNAKYEERWCFLRYQSDESVEQQSSWRWFETPCSYDVIYVTLVKCQHVSLNSEDRRAPSPQRMRVPWVNRNMWYKMAYHRTKVVLFLWHSHPIHYFFS